MPLHLKSGIDSLFRELEFFREGSFCHPARSSLPKHTTIQQMGAWTALVWNMGMGSPSSRSDETTWSRLSELIDEWSVDVALLNEVSTSILRDVDDAAYEVWGTRGRDRKHRPWSAAVLSRHGPTEIRDARAVSYRGRRPNVRFENSRPGSWIAASVRIPEVGDMTCVSLYGLTDELSEASVHRSLSELSPLFSDPRYRERLLLGGDLNTSSQWPKGPHLDGDVALLDRIEAYGLRDCLAVRRPVGPLAECRCTLDECTHTMTRHDPSHPGLQVDYLFASPALVEEDRLTKCEALPKSEWLEFSDHAPIVATFEY
jgi:endonuclease/exonuclease/phosphatase family metal-dependent hydrolase